MQDTLDEQFISSYLKHNTTIAPENIHISVFQTTESTNTQAKKLPAELARTGTVLLAEQQTLGRGRMGKSFYSPPYTGIYLSALYTPLSPVFDPAKITVTAAAAVCRAVSEICGKECGIKWVNDIFLNSRKICGILAEGILDPAAGTFRSIVIGIGINVFEQEDGFPQDIKNIAGTVCSNPQQTSFTRNELASSIISHLYNLLDSDYSQVLEEYRSRSLVIGKTITVLSAAGCYKAKAVGISDDAHLIVIPEDSAETISLCSGEISIKLD